MFGNKIRETQLIVPGNISRGSNTFIWQQYIVYDVNDSIFADNVRASYRCLVHMVLIPSFGMRQIQKFIQEILLPGQTFEACRADDAVYDMMFDDI